MSLPEAQAHVEQAEPEGQQVGDTIDRVMRQLWALEVPNSHGFLVGPAEYVTFNVMMPRPIEGMGAALFVRILRYIVNLTNEQAPDGHRLHWSWRARPEVSNERAYARLAVFWAVPAKAKRDNWQWVRRVLQPGGGPGGWEIAKVVPAPNPSLLCTWALDGGDIVTRDGIAEFGPNLEPPEA